MLSLLLWQCQITCVFINFFPFNCCVNYLKCLDLGQTTKSILNSKKNCYLKHFQYQGRTGYYLTPDESPTCLYQQTCKHLLICSFTVSSTNIAIHKQVYQALSRKSDSLDTNGYRLQNPDSDQS